MASFPFKPLQQTQLHLSSSFTCYYSSKFYLSFDPLSLSVSSAKHKLKLKLQIKLRVAAHSETRLSGNITEELSGNNVNTVRHADSHSGFSSSTNISKRAGRKSLERNHVDTEEPIERRVILKDRNSKIDLDSENGKQVGSGASSKRLKGKNLVKNTNSNGSLEVFDEDADKKEKRTKKPKDNSPGHILRIGLDMCSKRGDVNGAIKLYDLAKKEGIKMGQYHYAVLLYLCSSAATGTVQPAKSGSRGRNLNPDDNSVVNSESSSDFDKLVKRVYDSSKLHEHNRGELLVELPKKIEFNVDAIEDSRNSNNESLEDVVESLKKKAKADYSNSIDEENKGCGIEVSKEMKRIALQEGFQIYNKMRMENIPMNEATFTSVARMAMAFGDGDMAFDMVKQMKEYGINPKLRSYGPALAIFCSNGAFEKAFMVEKHMIDNGIYPEEPELCALLKVSLEGGGKSDKVYYVLHKLRTTVRQVSLGTADLIERWFNSKVASRVGKRKWDQEMIIEAMENGGGGWHGKGWLGRGKWNVCRARVDSYGLCTSCGEKLVTIDLDPEETESFAESVASIAAGRERNSSFQKFRKWLDYYGPFEAVVDGANVGLYAQRTFKPSKVNAVVNGIRRMLPSKRWPLIVLHNRRINGEKMNGSLNRALIDKWRNADALYATPTGSNDDWYWLYAAIKCRCFLVTNDEMRDHLFQLLGNDFFPKWKERHQVHFSFDETGLIFRMPPAFSVVIQESEKGHWHIPIVSELENEDERIWLCCSRSNSSLAPKDSPDIQKESRQKKRKNKIGAERKYTKLAAKEELQQLGKNVKTILFSSGLENRASIVLELEAAEEKGDCSIDFQI